MPRRFSVTELRLVGPLAALLVGAASPLPPASAGIAARAVIESQVGELADGSWVDLVADLDDDDADGRPDGLADERVPESELLSLTIRGGSTDARLELEGPLRFVRESRPIGAAAEVSAGRTTVLAIQATQGPHVGALHVSEAGTRRTIRLRIHRIELVDGSGRELAPERDSPRLSTRSPDVPLAPSTAALGADADDLFVRVRSPASPLGPGPASAPSERGIASDSTGLLLTTAGRRASDTPPLALPLETLPDGTRRTPWIRLYADAIDVALPERAPRLLRASLGDSLEARLETPTGALAQSIRLGRPSTEAGEEALRQLRPRFVVLRRRPGGPPVIGRDEREARALVEAQRALASDLFAPCFVELVRSTTAEVVFRSPPPPYMLVVGEEDGFAARGGGEIRFRANGRSIGPIPTLGGDPPLLTARRIAEAVAQAGLAADVIEVPRSTNGAGPAADVVVRDRRGEPAFLEADPSAPYGTDATQRVRVVDPSPYPTLRAFRASDALSGTAEERALVRPLRDADPRTIDVLFVPAFDRPERHGESFLVGDAGPLGGTVLIARIGVARMATAYTLAHELAHLLLDRPFHVEDLEEADPSRLLGSGPPRGDLRGPRRLSREECRTLRERSGPQGHGFLVVGPP